MRLISIAGIKKVSYGNIEHTQYKVEYEDGTLSYVPISEGNREYQLVQEYLIKKGVAVEEYEFFLDFKKQAIGERIKAAKDERKFLILIDLENNEKRVIISDSMFNIVKDQAIYAWFKMTYKKHYFFTFRNETTKEVIIVLDTDYSKDDITTIDSFKLLFSLLEKMESQLLSPNYNKVNDLIIQLNKIETIKDLETFEKNLDLEKDLVNGVIIRLSDFIPEPSQIKS